MRVSKGLYTPRPRYTLLDLISGKGKDYHLSDMKHFIIGSALVDPLDISRRDQIEVFIEKFQIIEES